MVQGGKGRWENGGRKREREKKKRQRKKVKERDKKFPPWRTDERAEEPHPGTVFMDVTQPSSYTTTITTTTTNNNNNN
ncbi:hypothetical protein E2C01_023540 [Portunus trituberculatus]|uniref:Uncharacterized protein n=1 Tax=Portunus trituberculatus TaxID=210409 RepID=A0A5B7EA46_PORTR|nr:hypothetical protein [Portunus trituberculatus]